MIKQFCLSIYIPYLEAPKQIWAKKINNFKHGIFNMNII
jgi:hypothetical protein